MDNIDYFLPLIPILLGVLGQFLPFIDTRKEFRDRISLRRESLRENLAEYLADLLNHVRSIQDTDDPLRGEPDLVKRYTTETWCAFDVLANIAWLQFWFRTGYLILFLTSIFSMGLVVGVLLLPEQWPLLKNAAVCAIIVQVIAITSIYLTSNRLEIHE